MSETFFEKIRKEYPSTKLDTISTKRVSWKPTMAEIKGRICVQIQITEDFKLTLDLLIIKNVTFNVILGSNFLEMIEYVKIKYKRQGIMVKTTIGEVQCKLAETLTLQ